MSCLWCRSAIECHSEVPRLLINGIRRMLSVTVDVCGAEALAGPVVGAVIYAPLLIDRTGRS